MRKFKTQKLQIILDDWSTGHEGAGPVESEKGETVGLSKVYCGRRERLEIGVRSREGHQTEMFEGLSTGKSLGAV